VRRRAVDATVHKYAHLSAAERVDLAYTLLLEKLGVTELPPMERRYSYPRPTTRRKKRTR
jgi:hypothetical protein